MTGLPPFTVEIDADTSTTGIAIVGTATVGGAGLVAAEHRWVAVPVGDVRSATTRRGRNREDQNNDVGTLTVTLDGFSGNYDPDNPSTTYQMAGVILLRTGVGVRLKVTVAAVDYYLFTGVLESTAADHGQDPTVTWTCVDQLARLGRAAYPPRNLSVAGRAGHGTSKRIVVPATPFATVVDDLLDYAQVRDTDRVISASAMTYNPDKGGGTVLANLESAVLPVQGRVYADRLNRLVVTVQADDWTRSASLAFTDADITPDTFVDIYADTYGGLGLEFDSLTVEPGALQVINDVTVVNTLSYIDADGAEQTVESTYPAQDATSVERFGKFTLNNGQAVQTSITDDAVGTLSQTLATYLATRTSVPASRASQVVTSLGGLSDTLTAAVAVLELGDRVLLARTTRDARSLAWDLHVEGIDHDITTTAWRMTLATSPRMPQLVY
jgi:hypothetical protein